MELQIQLFARARDLVGCDTIALTVPESATVKDLREILGKEYPQLKALLPQLLVAIDQSYAVDDAVLGANSQVACFPPVSGG